MNGYTFRESNFDSIGISAAPPPPHKRIIFVKRRHHSLEWLYPPGKRTEQKVKAVSDVEMTEIHEGVPDA